MLKLEPEKRYCHESALVDGHLYLFGGAEKQSAFSIFHSPKFVGRDEILVMNLRVEASQRKWLRRLARGRTIPPRCIGARCVVIDKMIYTYGGEKKDKDYLGIVHRLDPKKTDWIEVATLIRKKKPVPRAYCCLCVIGSRMIVFGGLSKKIPRDQLQSGATQDRNGWNNEIYGFEFEEGNEEGMWSDLELSGTRPKPLHEAAMATIDQHRALFHGIDFNNKSHSIVLDLHNKSWTIVDFNGKPSPWRGHTLVQLVKEEIEEKSLCLLIGGKGISAFESVYILDIDDSKAYQMNVGQEFQNLCYHTSHCVQNDDETTDILVYHEGLKFLHLDSRNDFFMNIERKLRWPMIQSELQHLQSKCAQLEEEVESANAAIVEEKRRFENAQMRQAFHLEQAELRRRSDVLTRTETEGTLVEYHSSLEIPTMSCHVESSDSEAQQRNDDTFALRQTYFSSQSRTVTEVERLLQQKISENLSIRQELEEAQRCLEEERQDLASCEEQVAETQRCLLQRDEEIDAIRRELESSREEADAAQLEISVLRLLAIEDYLQNNKLHVRDALSSAREAAEAQQSDVRRQLIQQESFYVTQYKSTQRRCNRRWSHNARPKSVYGAPWNDFARIVCETGFTKLRKIGDRLQFDWVYLQGLSESSEEGEHHCRNIVERYKQKNGDSKKVREEIIDALHAVDLGGLLNDNLLKNGFSRIDWPCLHSQPINERGRGRGKGSIIFCDDI